MATQYNLRPIRDLLKDGFSAEELRRFCFQEPAFKPVYDQLAQGSGKDEIVDRMMEYAVAKLLVDKLLAWAEKEVPERYKQGGPYVAQPAEQTATPQPQRQLGGGRTLGGLKTKPGVNPTAIGGSVLVSVVTPLNLEPQDYAFVTTEFKWLFSAIEHFLKLRRGEIDRSTPIAVAIPDEAVRDTQVNNQLLPALDAFDLQLWQGQFESGLKRINTYLRNLDILLDQESRKGDAGQGDVYLQNQIKSSRLEIVKVVRELAQLGQQAYGVLVTSPQQMVALLDG
ncbi:MAG: hypothetical protein KDI79_03435 [Anaerolineae bacterium]|nr:hypothetical protein [Anaerolineae bacterium]